MYAKTTDQGTAAAETALCGSHYTPARRAEAEDYADGDVVGPWKDCSGNPELECRVCGTKA